MSRIVWDAKHQGLKSEHLTKFHQEFDIFARIVYVKIRTDDLRHRAGKEAATCFVESGEDTAPFIKKVVFYRQYLKTVQSPRNTYRKSSSCVNSSATSGWNDISNERIEPWGIYRLGGPKSVCPTQLHQEEGKPLCPKYPAVRIRKRPVLSKTSGGRDWEEGLLNPHLNHDGYFRTKPLANFFTLGKNPSLSGGLEIHAGCG
ncbi:predicted protein [Histoplasma capsulatum H143]|uniref:Uncharacterized protein n=1 Tax=Ajellomyces capsulatus (strain H143) TaxID=544712 RepID=C6HQM9_AJECH|nr:predicted protein [Histoplasma capsulatum H143]